MKGVVEKENILVCGGCGFVGVPNWFRLDKRNNSGYGSCRRCHNIAAKKYRDKKIKPKISTEQKRRYRKNYKLKYPEAVRAQTAVYLGKRKKKLNPMPCAVCSTTGNIQAHHPNYNNKYDVLWLCEKHHIGLHYLERLSKLHGRSQWTQKP